MANKHNDCTNFAIFDVAKGLCLKTEGLVTFDGEACPCFEQKQKCKNCAHFHEPNEEGVGACTGLSDESYWALGERVAVNCDGYEKAK